MYKHWISALSLVSVAYAASPKDETDPITELRSMRVELRHIENKGVGYNTGYSSLDIFLAPSPDRWSVMPFLNLRGHVLDDAKFATNVGLGFRTLAGCRVYGMNAYWDYRNTNRFHYNQVGVGFETLGTRWDFRLNGYLPVAAKTSHPYHTHNASSVSFVTFSGHNALVRRNTSSSRKEQFAMKGLDAEAVYHILKHKNFDLYPAIGPYYYQYKNKHAIGGRVRLGAQLTKYLTVEVIDTYDNLFHNNFQGSVSVNIPFGPKPKARENGRFSGCEDGYFVCQRMLQDVHRQEMIVVDSRRIREAHSEVSVAINPATGQPYVFYFVDNTSHSTGTYESPFNTLLDAQMAAAPYDSIYVFPGNGTSMNMDQGVTLIANQSLLGASTSHPLITTLGDVLIPPLATTLPVITNTAGPVVTLSGDNTLVSGFYIENTQGTGIQGSLINNLSINNNNIIGNNNYGIDLNNIGGLVNIDNNVITVSTSIISFATSIVQSSASCNVLFSNNTVYGSGANVIGVFTLLSNTGSIGSLQILDNTFLGHGNIVQSAIRVSMTEKSTMGLLDVQNNHSSLFGTGLDVTVVNAATLVHATTKGNHLGNDGNGSSGIVFILQDDGTVGTIAITDSVLSSVSGFGADIFSTSSGSIEEITISNTQMNTSQSGLALEFDGTGSVGNILISNCSMNAHTVSGSYLTLGGSGSVGTYTMDSCSLSGNPGGQALGFNVNNSGSIGHLTITNSNLDNNPNGGSAFGLSLNSSGSVGNLTVDGCSMSGNTGSQAINLAINSAGSIGNVSIANSNFNNNPNGGFVVGAVLANGSTGSISNIGIDHCNIMYNNNSYAILADCSEGGTGGIENLIVSNCHLDYSVNGGGVQADGNGVGTVHNVVITDTTITNSQNDIYINLNNASMNSIVVSNVDASSSIGFSFNANLANGSTIGSIAIDHFTSEASLNGIVLLTDATSAVGNFNMSNLLMNGTPNSHVAFFGQGSYGNVSITNSVLNDAAMIGINLPSPITSLTITDCSLEFNGLGIEIASPTTNTIIANNMFKNSKIQGLRKTVASGLGSCAIQNNTFSGTAFPANGYGAAMIVNGGNLCLDFQQNKAMPSQDGSFAPFIFVQTGGTFDLTSQTTQANNVGTITTIGTVGAPGSCTQ